MKKLLLAMVISAAAILSAGCGFSYTYHASNELSKKDAMEFTIEKTRVDQISEIDINSRTADIEVLTADDFYVEIKYLYWDDEPEYSIKDGALKFDDRPCMPDSYSLRFTPDNIIRIYLPEGTMLDRAEIVTSSGDVNAEGFIARILNLTISYGDLDLGNAAAAKADILLSSGRSRIKGFNAGKLNFTDSYGQAEFTDINTGGLLLPEDTETDYIKIVMSSGDCTITNAVSRALDVRDSYGNVTCEDITFEELDMNLSSGDLDIIRGNLNEADVTNSYGNVSMSLYGNEEDCSLDLDTSYGNIEVAGDSYEGKLRRENNGLRNIRMNLSSGDIDITFLNK